MQADAGIVILLRVANRNIESVSPVVCGHTVASERHSIKLSYILKFNIYYMDIKMAILFIVLSITFIFFFQTKMKYCCLVKFYCTLGRN